jgi:hypothetical protein
MSFIYIHKKELAAIFAEVAKLTKANDVVGLEKFKSSYIPIK